MSEQPKDGELLLNLGDESYDLALVGKALAFARDFVISEDIRNAAKNLGEIKFSQLTTLLDEALDMLKEIFTRHAVQVPPDEAEAATTS